MFFRNRPPAPQQKPAWVGWILIGFIIFGLMMSARKEGSVHKSVEQAAHNLAPEKLFKLDDYKKLFAYGETPRVQDVKPGEGAPVICGQKVMIAYGAFLPDGTAIGDTSQSLSFRAGTDEALPALAKGVLGMKTGGKRSIVAPASMAYDSPGYAREGVPKGTSVRFEVTLVSASPKLPDIDKSPFRIAVIQSGAGPTIACGDAVKVHVNLWGLDGRELYSSRDKGVLAFTPGKSEAAIGLEQGIIGMAPGSVRTLVIPPNFQKTMNGNAPATALPFPQNQTVLADVIYAP